MFTPASKLWRLNRLVERAWEGNAFYRCKWLAAGLSPGALDSLEQLGRFPFTSRAEIAADQARHAPLGSNMSGPPAGYQRIHSSSGTSGQVVLWLDDRRSWRWLVKNSQELYRMAGVRAGDRVMLCSSFGASLGPWVLYEGACRLGCLCFVSPSTDASEQAAAWLTRMGIDILVASPQRALDLASKARQLGSRVRRIITAGGKGRGDASIHARITAAWGAECLDRYGLTEAGSVASACNGRCGGMHVLDEEFIAEAVEPGGERAVGDGEAGELVLTTLGRIGSPIIRYRTGDLARLARNVECACGRRGTMILGSVSRIDIKPVPLALP
jgi:phenylacetate-CoA ligase